MRTSESGHQMAKRVVDVLVPVALDRAYSYRAPAELELAPGDIVTVPLGPRETTGVVWAENAKPNPRLDNRLKDVEEKLRIPAAQARAAQLRRLGGELHAQRARHGAAHVPAHGRASRRRARAARRAARRRGARTANRARARVLALFADGMVRGKTEAAREAGVSAGVIDGLVDEGTLQTVVLPPEPVAQPPDPDFLQCGLDRRPARRRRGPANHRRQGRLLGHAARWRHRLGQDRGLFRSGGGYRSRRPAELDPDAGDCAHHAISRPLLGPFRYAARGVAFRTDAAPAGAHLARRRRW